jgi:hypothetical protein
VPEAGRGLLRTCTLARMSVEPVNIIIGIQKAIRSDQDCLFVYHFEVLCIGTDLLALLICREAV